MHSQFSLELGLPLPRRFAGMLARRGFAPDVKQLKKPAEMAPIALAGEHRRPAMFVIFGTDVTAAIARVECVEPGARAEASEGAGEHHINGTKAVVDPALAVIWISHARTPLQRLGFELGTRSEI